MARNYKDMLYILLNKMSAEDIEGPELEDRYGKEYRDFYCEYETSIYKSRVKAMLQFYPVPMVVGAVHQLFQGYHIADDTEDDLYGIADPNGDWNEPSMYSYWRDDENPLLRSEPFTMDDKNCAKQAAKDYCNWFSEMDDLHLDEISKLQKHFVKLGKKYGLSGEFRKSGIIC